jgi:hypothetical protein
VDATFVFTTGGAVLIVAVGVELPPLPVTSRATPSVSTANTAVSREILSLRMLDMAWFTSWEEVDVPPDHVPDR